MSDLAAILTVWIGGLVGPGVGVVAYNTRTRTGRWPWEYGVTAGDLWSAMTAEGREYLDGWQTDRDDGEVLRRVASFVVSLGLLWRAAVHSLVAALSYPDGAPDDINHALVWTPLEMDRIPLWTARILTFGSGLAFISLAPALRWGWPEWAEWIARAYIAAQGGVWVAEPIAMIRDYARR